MVGNKTRVCCVLVQLQDFKITVVLGVEANESFEEIGDKILSVLSHHTHNRRGRRICNKPVSAMTSSSGNGKLVSKSINLIKI